MAFSLSNPQIAVANLLADRPVLEIVMNILKLSTIALVVIFPASSSGQSEVRDVTVKAALLSPARWAVEVNRKLERVLIYPYLFSNELPRTGMVSVRFHADDMNRPSMMAISRTSGIRAFDKAAMMAVSRIGAMPLLPATFRQNQAFVANIIYAASEGDYDQQVAVLRKEAKTLAEGPAPDPNTTAFVITSHVGVAS
ncbi:hypothetical protein [Sphingomonas phyllosphaerae]|uniref:hypothetical protein n=1 Tax=Sphingomonas phyllosphaerae TaxID=257003 RepID=UPI0012DCAD56|nr:hypothetical protein [Sphingomonas phyllosphaerae]